MIRLPILALACLALLVAGCSRSPQVTFYTLLPAASGEAVPATEAPVSVSVGPITVPEVVDRPQLVVRESESRVKIAETHRWAEPLKREIPRVLAQNLGSLLGTEQVSSYPQNAGADAQYRVQVDVQRFEALPGKSVTVEALWQIKRSADNAQGRGHSLVREPVQGDGYEPLVAAYSRALSRVSAELAQAIRACGQVPSRK
ncbi:PqiC family protein [Geomonas sp. RF6]|uniref:PqiC family protein n=1 Tax=Geomonas sp. RF6 TaxID=2897342 RepID=UPI001E55ADFC|nr:PqiC family protein [Geomonas sp. RF6]UFS70802.1 PqiC family protein [Geomonas sp. RF6]